MAAASVENRTRVARRERVQWAETVLANLKEHNVRLMTYVPDNMLIPLIDGAQADPHFTAFTATREEEAIGIACGADMAGMRAVVLMQSSGFGNTVNALASLAVPYQLPVLMFISERGVIGEFNSVQMPITRAMRPTLDALGIPHVTLSRMDELAFLTHRMTRQCFQTRTPAALFLSPLLTGGKTDV
jgi:sulfopyruvate decarboxylase alpha subunit